MRGRCADDPGTPMIQALVFLPLLAFLVAGIGNRAIGNVAAKSVTTGALFVSCALAWVTFIGQRPTW
jgi:NADH-quinone oxidoreductase subunit L